MHYFFSFKNNNLPFFSNNNQKEAQKANKEANLSRGARRSPIVPVLTHKFY